MNILIRVDSSKAIGSGHLMRCLTLAERQRKSGDNVTFVCRDLEGNLSSLVLDKGFNLVLLPKANKDVKLLGYAEWLSVTQEQDATEMIEEIKHYGKVNRVVVDSYAIDERWEKLVRPYTDELFVVDDLANRHHDCDFLVDQNFYLDKENRYHGLVPESCKLLLGPQYALLREEFLIARENMHIRDGRLQQILVFYGGVDATDETGKALRALVKMNLPEVHITVVVGSGNSRKYDIDRLCQKAGFTYLCQINNMAELMGTADLMLGAGGTTTWERCYLGLPAIVTAVAENQWQICEDCAQAGVIYYLGHSNEVVEDDICQAVKQLSSCPDLLLDMQNSCLSLMQIEHVEYAVRN